MNILVTGANGQLGNEIRILTGDSRHNYIYTDVVEAEGNRTTMLDITNAEDVKAMVANHNIDVIINCAAYTNVDAAEDNEALAEKLNSEAPAILANAMAETGGLLVHIRTACKFLRSFFVPSSHKI